MGPCEENQSPGLLSLTVWAYGASCRGPGWGMGQEEVGGRRYCECNTWHGRNIVLKLVQSCLQITFWIWRSGWQNEKWKSRTCIKDFATGATDYLDHWLVCLCLSLCLILPPFIPPFTLSLHSIHLSYIKFLLLFFFNFSMMRNFTFLLSTNNTQCKLIFLGREKWPKWDPICINCS